MISAAASVSVIGAFPDTSRYPLLCRDTPDVSIPTVTTSFFRKTRTGYAAPSSANHSTWYFCCILLTIAFFITDWISDGLNNLLFTDAAFATQNFPFSGI